MCFSSKNKSAFYFGIWIWKSNASKGNHFIKEKIRMIQMTIGHRWVTIEMWYSKIYENLKSLDRKIESILFWSIIFLTIPGILKSVNLINLKGKTNVWNGSNFCTYNWASLFDYRRLEQNVKFLCPNKNHSQISWFWLPFCLFEIIQKSLWKTSLAIKNFFKLIQFYW